MVLTRRDYACSRARKGWFVVGSGMSGIRVPGCFGQGFGVQSLLDVVGLLDTVLLTLFSPSEQT